MTKINRTQRTIALADAMGHPWIADHGRRKLRADRAASASVDSETAEALAWLLGGDWDKRPPKGCSMTPSPPPETNSWPSNQWI